MQFRFTRKDSLPKSAWLAHIRRDLDAVDLYHGSSVEARDRFFVEGAWDGDFTKGDFVNAITLLGSGGRIVDDGTVVFAAASHIYERLYALRIHDVLYVSNSLVFLLTHSGEALDERYSGYPQTLYRKYGMTESDKSIPTKGNHRVQLFYYTNLVIQPDLEIKEVAKSGAEEFSDYNSYVRFLETTVIRVFENANDSSRNTVYGRPVASVSSGYDSPASSVFAKKIGCSDALTFRKARPLQAAEYRGGDDSGTAIAAILEMNCQECERLDYLTSSDWKFPEAEVFATSHLVDLNMLSLEQCLDHTCMLFTGYRGDIMWSRQLYENQDSGGPGMAEFRLRVGFVNFPVPYLGTTDCQPTVCRVSKSVRRISNSGEMAPWSVGGDYDRPIPRRIVEEAGVERGAFARENKATAVWFGKESPQDIMTPDSFADFQAFSETVAGPAANRAFLWGVEKLKDRYQL